MSLESELFSFVVSAQADIHSNIFSVINGKLFWWFLHEWVTNNLPKHHVRIVFVFYKKLLKNNIRYVAHYHVKNHCPCFFTVTFSFNYLISLKLFLIAQTLRHLLKKKFNYIVKVLNTTNVPWLSNLEWMSSPLNKKQNETKRKRKWKIAEQDIIYCELCLWFEIHTQNDSIF